MPVQTVFLALFVRVLNDKFVVTNSSDDFVFSHVREYVCSDQIVSTLVNSPWNFAAFHHHQPFLLTGLLRTLFKMFTNGLSSILAATISACYKVLCKFFYILFPCVNECQMTSEFWLERFTIKADIFLRVRCSLQRWYYQFCIVGCWRALFIRSQGDIYQRIWYVLTLFATDRLFCLLLCTTICIGSWRFRC